MPAMKDNRYIRIFLSSTFEDLQPERDYLITKVFPRLRDIARQRDVALVPIDLRWGVNTSDVIQTCFDEISNSRPFFIGIIGQRYGWCPTLEDLHANERLDELYGEDIKHYIAEGMSITEMEMQYGVLQLPDEMKKGTTAYFYIKDCDVTDGKLIRLREKVRDNGFFPVAPFTSPEELGEQVERDFMQMLNARYPDRPLTDFEREHRAHELYLLRLTEFYFESKSMLDALNQWLAGEQQIAFLSSLSPGNGVTTLLSNWIQRIEGNVPYHIIYHFVGIEDNYDANTILLHIANELVSFYNLPLPDKKDIKHAENFLLQTINNPVNTKPILIILDGINGTKQSASAITDWFGQCPKSIRILHSGGRWDYGGTYVNKTSPYECAKIFYNPYPDYGGYKPFLTQFINTYLLHYRKRLSEQILDNILKGIIGNFSSIREIKMLLDIIINYGRYDSLEQHIDHFLDIEKKHFLLLVVDWYKETYGAEFVEQVIYLLLVSYKGLSEEDIINITGVTQLQWSQFYCAFKGNTLIREGRLVIENWWQQSSKILLREDALVGKARRAIIDYYKQKHIPSGLVGEIAYQYYMLGMAEELHSYLLQSKVALAMMVYDEQQFISYWAYLLSLEGARYSLEEYFDMQFDRVLGNQAFFNWLGIVAHEMGDNKLSNVFTERAADYQEKTDDASLALRYNNIGTSHFLSGQKEEGIRLMCLSLEYQRSATGEDSAMYATREINLGNMYSKVDDFAKARKYILHGVSILEKLGKEYMHDVAIGYSVLGDIARWEDNPEEAVKLHTKALDVLSSIQQVNTRDGAGIYEKLAYDYEWMDKLLKAYEATDRAYVILRNTQGVHAPFTLNEFAKKIDYARGSKIIDADEAIHQLEENLAVVLQLNGNYDWILSNYYFFIASAYDSYTITSDVWSLFNNEKKYTEEEVHAKWRKAIEYYLKLEQLRNQGHDNTSLYESIADLYSRLGDVENAEKYRQLAN